LAERTVRVAAFQGMIQLVIVLKVIAAFNHTWERADVLARDAQIPDFAACWKQERSQMYFKPARFRLVSPDVVEVAATGQTFGLYGVETVLAIFELKKEGADWKISSLRVLTPCLSFKR
jgi:hypothetical protein